VDLRALGVTGIHRTNECTRHSAAARIGAAGLIHRRRNSDHAGLWQSALKGPDFAPRRRRGTPLE